MHDPKTLRRIRKWMKNNDLSLSDLGLSKPLEQLGLATIASLLEAMAEDEARDQHRRYEEQEAFAAALEEEVE